MHVEWRTIVPGKRKLLVVADTPRESADLALLAHALSGDNSFSELELQTVDATTLLALRDLRSFHPGAGIVDRPAVNRLLAESWRL